MRANSCLTHVISYKAYKEAFTRRAGIQRRKLLLPKITGKQKKRMKHTYQLIKATVFMEARE